MPEHWWPHAALYLSGTGSSYWQRSDNQEISWADGRTIAFLPEIVTVLNRLAPEGLPPFGAVLLLIAACRENWGDPPSRRGLLAGLLDNAACDAASINLTASKPESGKSSPLLNEVWDGLDKVHALPCDLRYSPAAKADLAAAVFDGLHGRLSPQVSKDIVEALATWNGSLPAGSVAMSTYSPTRDLGALRAGLARIDETNLRLRAKTGLETLPAPAPIDVPPLTGRAWLGWLEQQEEFAGLGRLAKRLLAAIHIPRNLNEPDELPLGGITDIAPRGPLDRLLLSELAHDDLTLAVRVAMNEALYLRRESPPRTPPHQRHILLDSGLRLWGSPRLYATAVALAMTAQNDPHLNVRVYRAAGKGLARVVMNTAEGLRNHLAALDHRLHPGDALPRLVELLDESEGGDAVVVTSDDTFNDPAFQRALERSAIGSVYFATVSRDGRFELRQYSSAGSKHISKADLPLDEILRGPRQAVRMRDADKGPLPAIFRAAPFPLLLSAPVTLDNSWYVHELGLLTLTGDGRLLRWNIQTQGAEQLATGLPPGRIFGATDPTNDSGRICVILGRLSTRGLHAVLMSRDGKVDSAVPLQVGGIGSPAVMVDQTAAYVAMNQSVTAIDLTSRNFPAVRADPQVSAADVRSCSVFKTISQLDGTWAWYRPTLLGQRIEYLMVCRRELLRMFEVRGIEGPVGITPEGNLFFTKNDEIKTVEHGLPSPVCEAVSRDGLRFILKGGDQRMVVHTLNGSAKKCSDVVRDLEPYLHLLARPRPFRRRFQGIGVDLGGQLSLIMRKNAKWTLQMPAMSFLVGAPTVDFSWEAFSDWEHSDIAGFCLKRATFPSGSVAALDSRGLLHLRSAEANIPECTIVLCEGPTAGWCADGRVWGPEYYLGSQKRAIATAETIAREVIGPFLERLR